MLMEKETRLSYGETDFWASFAKSKVDWNEFSAKLISVLQCKVDHVDLVKPFLAELSDSTAYVTRDSLDRFLKWFNPFDKCIEEAYSVCTKPWFHGLMNKDATEQALKQPQTTKGTYLIRLSTSTPGDFILAFLGNGAVIQKILVKQARGNVLKEIEAEVNKLIEQGKITTYLPVGTRSRNNSGDAYVEATDEV